MDNRSKLSSMKRKRGNRLLNYLMKVSFLFFFFLPVICPFENAFAQKKPKTIDILKTNKLIGGMVNGQSVRKLLGDVVLQSKNQTMYCDSAYQFLNKPILQAFGNIEIKSKKEIIWADSATYNTSSNISKFAGRVIIKNKKATLFSNHATYSYKKNIATFPGKIRMEDKKGTLLADDGIYYNKKDSAVFRGNVQIADSTQYAETDTLYSNRAKRYYEMHGNVFIRDIKNHVKLAGNFIKADSSGYRQLRGNAIMEKIKDHNKDTSYVWGREINYWEHDSTYVFKAAHNVHIWTSKFSSISDTATYVDSTGKFTLLTNAKAWYKHLQISGPLIKVTLKHDTIRTLRSYPNPFVVAKDSTTGRLNQIAGDTILAKFHMGQLYSMLVYPHAQMLYFTHNQQKKPDGAIQMTADSVKFFFAKGNLKKLKALKNINGNYLAETKTLPNQKLKGFVWTPKSRPKKPTGKRLKARLPAVPKSRPFHLPPRYVSYIKSLDKQKKAMPPPTQHSP